MVVWVETHVTQGACAYPITSSTTMGGGYQAEVANGKRNLWGEELAFIEPESEHSAAGTCEGRSEEHTSELQSPYDLVCRLLLEKKKITKQTYSKARNRNQAPIP